MYVSYVMFEQRREKEWCGR